MMPLNLFRLQVAEAFSGYVRQAVRFLVTLLLAIPFLFVNMPAHAKASGLVMVILFTTFFGSAIAHARLCEDGRFARLGMLPTLKPLLWLDLILATFIGRIVPTLILLVGFIIVNSPVIHFASVIYITAELCAAILLLVIVATLIGHIARSNGQVHLLGALACGIIALVSGVLPTVPKLSLLNRAVGANPLYRLKVALIGATTETLSISSLKFSVSCVIIGFALLLLLQRTIAGSGNTK